MTLDEIIKRLDDSIAAMDRLISEVVHLDLGLSGEFSLVAGDLDRLRDDLVRTGMTPAVQFVTNDLNAAGQFGWRGVFRASEGTIAVMSCMPPLDAGLRGLAMAWDGALTVAPQAGQVRA